MRKIDDSWKNDWKKEGWNFVEATKAEVDAATAKLEKLVGWPDALITSEPDGYGREVLTVRPYPNGIFVDGYAQMDCAY